MKKLKKTISIIILIIALILFLAISFMKNNYGNVFVEAIYYLFNGVANGGGDAITDGIKTSIIPFIFLFTLLSIPIIGILNYNLTFKIEAFNKKIILNLPLKHNIIYSIIILIISVLYSYKICDIHSLIDNYNNTSTIYEEYYVNGKDLEITFPNEKKNLILIFAESMESTYFSKENGGSWGYKIIPELEELALENVNFSGNEKLGGAYSTTGTTWTVSGMVAQTAGVNMSLFQQNSNNNNYKKESFLSGSYALGDILEENGYNLELLIGSDAEFGGRKQYFQNHGNYKIFDYNYAKSKGLVSDYIWWGYEDYKMFDFAKQELNELAKKEEPFNLILLTADTHFTDGCMECVRQENKVTNFSTTFENVLASSSKEINAFVNWLKEQEYYEDTTIVIVGDHLSMQNDYFSAKNIAGKDRRIYNVFINSSAEPTNQVNRHFSTLDIYPTILASIGAEIPGNKIGLGTNLFSEEQTLFEKLGVGVVQEELGRRSVYYNEKIVGADYTDIITGNLN